MNAEFTEIQTELCSLLQDFFAQVKPRRESLFVIGCSTSEILGGRIGKAGSAELGELLAGEIIAAAEKAGVVPIAQCCEHLNRALVVDEKTAAARGFTIVSAVPKPHAGGSFAAAFWRALPNPVLVEAVSADMGLDIGQTLIGMHLKRVAVPVRLKSSRLGEAVITAAFTRPPLIGGARAEYA